MERDMDKRLIDDLESAYRISPRRVTPIDGGWMNRLWRVTDGENEWVVKQYSLCRFNPRQLEDIERALHRQELLHRRGVCCPSVRLTEGRTIRWMEDGAAYAVFAFLPGRNETPQTVTAAQIRSLGGACALVHEGFASLPETLVKGFPLDGKRLLNTLRAHAADALRLLSVDSPASYRRAVLALEPILRRLRDDVFDRLPRGIAHEDFTPDNLLFDDRGVTAVIDFDRNQYSFLWHDVGRAVLSFALDGQQLDLDKVCAFVEGYAQYRPLTVSDIADALRVSWCLEVPWWIQPKYFTMDSGKAVRYRDEIVWLGERWFEIDELLRR